MRPRIDDTQAAMATTTMNGGFHPIVANAECDIIADT